jgi:hypothetical protein
LIAIFDVDPHSVCDLLEFNWFSASLASAWTGRGCAFSRRLPPLGL